MRVFLATVLAAAVCMAQFRSTSQLVVAPTTVTDSKGRFIDGLTKDDLILSDNSVAQPIQMEWQEYPIDLVVAVQTSANSMPVIDKLGDLGILLSQLLAAYGGETAIISFSDTVKTHQDFTGDPDKVTHSLQMLRKEGGDAHMLDALQQSLGMLERRSKGRRRIVLMIAENRDRGSIAPLPDVMARAQRLNAAVYWVTFSPFLQPFTVRPKVAEDLNPIAERIKFTACLLCPRRDETPVPYDPGPGGLLYGIGELARMSLPDLAALFTDATGGRTLSFVKKDALEQAIQLIAAEVHRQYILTFEPKDAEPGSFHAIRVMVKGRPDLQVKSRTGYWVVN